MDTRLSQIERDLASQSTILNRYDATIEKLAEVSASLSKLLAVQDKRIEITEKTVEKLESNVELRRKESDLLSIEMSKEFAKISVVMNQKIDDKEASILQRIEDRETNFNTRVDKLETRTSKSEKLIWIAVGMATIVALVVNLFGPVLI